MNICLSFIVPVYNRPEEVEELLASLAKQQGQHVFEVVIVEDGSNEKCDKVCNRFSKSDPEKNHPALSISYYFKENSGPGASRNYGMERAKGNYFIILDSDCIIPPHYVTTVLGSLEKDFIHCFGGPDAAHPSFSRVQKAIDYSMTSWLTTGGIRGGRRGLGKFQPRSFNMGLSKEAFEATQGFGHIHPGEDPELVFRLWELGYNTYLLPEAYVYHKRRIDWTKFYNQVRKFGLVRPILNQRYPMYTKPTFWLPTLFCLGVIGSMGCAAFGWYLPLALFLLYLVVLFLHASLKTKSVQIAAYALIATMVQFYGYGKGFLEATWNIQVLKKDPEKYYPHLFFK